MSNEQKVLIFDLGGGTIDVSILTIDNGVFQVISTFGDTHLGGEDFDDRLFYHFLQEFIRDHHDDLFNDKKARRRLKVECEKAKRILTSATIARIDIDSLKNGIDFHSSITRVRFEELNADFFQKIMECVENAIQNVGNRIDKTQIDHVVLVGGSSRDPKIQKMLRDIFDGKELNKSINPDEAVAYGATALAAILNGVEEVRDVVLFDVTPLSLGLAVKNRNGPDLKMCKVIKRNTLIPAKLTKPFFTSYDNQTKASIDVYEGEYDFTKDNHLLGKFTLSGIPPAPAGVAEIDVTLEIDVNGILNVTAVEKSTSNSRQITISYDRGRLSKDEIERMIKDAEECRVLKKKRKAALLAKNSLESYCVDVKSIVEDPELKNKIDESDKNIILKKCEETIVWLEDSDRTLETRVYELKHEELKTVFDVIISIANYSGKKEDKYYEILNVEKNASLNDIERAFRKVSFKYHPDKCQVDQEVGNMFWLTLTKARKSLIDLANQRLNQS